MTGVGAGSDSLTTGGVVFASADASPEATGFAAMADSDTAGATATLVSSEAGAFGVTGAGLAT